MLEDFRKSQNIAYAIAQNTIKKNRLSHAYLIEGNGYCKKLEFAVAFAKYLLCDKHHLIKPQDYCEICSKEGIENILDIKIISPDGLWIKKSQLENLQIEFGKKAIDGNKKIYIITDADKLNTSSANSILKFLEEPEEGIIAILIVDNLYQVLPTIISRCQIIHLKSEVKKEYISTIDAIIENNVSNLEKEKLIEKIKQVEKFIMYFELYKKEILLYLKKYNLLFEDKEMIIDTLELMIYFYKDILNNLCGRNIEIYIDYRESIEKISKSNNIETICDKINIINDYKEKLKLNINVNLMIDNMINDLEDVSK